MPARILQDSFLILEQRSPGNPKNCWFIQCAVARQGPDRGCCSAEIGIFSPGGARLWGRTVPDVQKVTALFSAAYNHRKVDVFDFRETEV